MESIRIRSCELVNADKVWHLRQASLVNGLSDEDLAALAAICKDRVFGRGETIFERGESANQIYIVFRGSVRSSVGSAGGKERIVGFFKSGDVLGENILGPSPVHRSQAVAHEESWVGSLSRQEFVRLLRERPSLAMNFIRILTDKLGDAQEDIKALSFLGTQQRLAKTLLELGRNHGKTIVAQESVRKLRFPLSHEHLARLIGANRPHVSTIMSQFRKSGWIHYQGRKLLINMEKLANGTRVHRSEASQAAVA